MRKRTAALLILLALCLLMAGASAEAVRVMTPGGGVKMRKTPETKGRLVTTIPNHTLVEALEVGEEWTRVAYKEKEGYVMNEFLLLPGDLPGKTVYPDGETALLYAAPDADSALTGVYNSHQPLTVLQLREGWAQVQPRDGAAGWITLAELTWQRSAPEGAPGWIPQGGVTVEAAPWPGLPDGLPRGAAVTVLASEDDRCLAKAEGSYGFLPIKSVSLNGPEEADGDLAGISREQAEDTAWTTLKKAKAARDREHYCVVGVDTTLLGVEHPLYHCGFYDGDDRYVHGALIDPADGRVVFSASYEAFALRPKRSLLPDGEVRLALSAQTLAVGEVLDIRVDAWTDHAITWSVAGDAISPFTGEEGTHFEAAYRPRKPGNYTVTVTVRDELEQTVTESADFRVEEGGENTDLSLPYSQKDGWWQDKAYRQSNLDRSGCAIFTLSHALQRLGFDGEDIRPEQLAKKYALCLTPDGTNNERLIREASQVYGYRTRGEPVTSRKKAVEVLQAGGLFSFGVVRGHIALVDGISGDGTMVHVVDSAPGATWERKGETKVWYEGRGGMLHVAESPESIPGARWYFDQENWGGLEYWMTLDYALDRNLRLIQPVDPGQTED